MTAMISAVDDTAVEGDHDFTVSILSSSPLATVGMSSVTATILDDDRECDSMCEGVHSFVHSHSFFQFTVGDAAVEMKETTLFVNEDIASGTVRVCAEIVALPGDLQTDLTVTLTTTNTTKAGLHICYTIALVCYAFFELGAIHLS